MRTEMRQWILGLGLALGLVTVQAAEAPKRALQAGEDAAELAPSGGVLTVEEGTHRLLRQSEVRRVAAMAQVETIRTVVGSTVSKRRRPNAANRLR